MNIFIRSSTKKANDAHGDRDPQVENHCLKSKDCTKKHGNIWICNVVYLQISMEILVYFIGRVGLVSEIGLIIEKYILTHFFLNF